MKLDFITESTADWSQFKDGLPADKYHDFIGVIETLTKGFKFVSASKVEDTDKNTTYLFSNSILEMKIMAGLSGKSEEPYILAMISVLVSEKLMIAEAKKTSSADRILLNFHLFMHDSNAIAEAGRVATETQKSINEFIEWYFDVSGEYGKVKMIQVQGSVVEGYSRGGENRFVAIAGDFHTEKDMTEKSRKETEKRVF